MFDKEREVSKLDSVAELAHSEINSHGVRELFEHIMSVSRKRQYQLLTEHGKFAPTGFVEVKELDFTHAAAAFIPASEDAAKSYFPEECGLQKCTDWRKPVMYYSGKKLILRFFQCRIRPQAMCLPITIW